MHFHSNFPKSSIVLYVKKKFLCKIALSPTQRERQKIYINTRKYQETSDEIAIIPNLDHRAVFTTKSLTWIDVKNTCDKHGAIFYRAKVKGNFDRVMNYYEDRYYHLGIHLRNNVWTDVVGENVTLFFWANGQPNNIEEKRCVGMTPSGNMANINCFTTKRIGLCVY